MERRFPGTLSYIYDTTKNGMIMTKKFLQTIIPAAIVVIAMFSFSFALVPLYRVFCQVTGLNTSIKITEEAKSSNYDKNRQVLVQLVTTMQGDFPWDFYPLKKSLKVHVGDVIRVDFFAKNNAKQTMTVQAIPSFAPTQAGRYFHKIECFCFTQQTLSATETKKMPVVFRISNDLPKNINTITLAYTLFAVHSKGLHDEKKILPTRT